MAVRGYKDGHGRVRYLIEFQQRGVRVLERCPPSVTYAQAQERETQLRRGIYDGETLGRKPQILLSDVIQQWLDTKPHRNHRTLVNMANRLAPFVAGKTLQQAPEVATDAAKSWTDITHPITAAQNAGRKHKSDKRTSLTVATINRRLAILKAATHWAFDQGMIQENLSARIKLRREENQREVYLSRQQVRSLAAASASEAVGSAILIAAYTGLRASELLALPKQPTQSRSLTIARSKSGKPRVIPVPASLDLRALPLGLSYDQLRHGFEAARDAAGLGKEVTFHCLRHTYASWMINAGVDLLTLSKLLGHSTVAVTQRYAHLYDSTLRKAVERLK